MPPTPPRPVRPAPGPVMDAMQSAARELQRTRIRGCPCRRSWNVRPPSAQCLPPPPSCARCSATTIPTPSNGGPPRPGRLAYRARLQPLHYKGDAGVRTDWDEALLDLDMDKAGKTVDFTGRWNTVSAEDPAMRLSAEGITLSGHQRRSGTSSGSATASCASPACAATPRKPRRRHGLSLDDLRMDWRTVEHPKTVDMQFQQRIGSIDAAGEKVEDVRFDVRIVNLDRARWWRCRPPANASASS
jgi:hypothetical protein